MPHLTLRRPSASMLVAVLAVVLAMGGTATAAKKLLGSADVKNNSLTSSDIKNGTLGTADLSSSAKKALKGAAGPKGATGPQGSPGAAGAQGLKGDKGDKGDQGVPGAGSTLPTIYFNDLPNYALPMTAVNFVVLTKALPAGRYLLNAKLNAVSGTDSTLVCKLVSNFTDLDTAPVRLTASAENQLVLTAAAEVPAAGASITCLNATAATTISAVKFTAVPATAFG